MTIAHPTILLLAAAAAAVVIVAARRAAASTPRGATALRAAAVALLAIAAAGPAITRPGRARLRILVVDVSPSHAARARDLLGRLGKTRHGLSSDDRVAVVLFDSAPWLAVPPVPPAELPAAVGGLVLPDADEGTDIASALALAADVAARSPERVAEVVLASDGRDAGAADLRAAAAGLRARGVPLFALAPAEGAGPATAGVIGLGLPGRVAPGEPVVAEVTVRAAGAPFEVMLEVSATPHGAREPAVRRRESLALAAGEVLVRPVALGALGEGYHRIEAAIAPAGDGSADAVAADDRREALLRVGQAGAAIVVLPATPGEIVSDLLWPSWAPGLFVERVRPDLFAATARAVPDQIDLIVLDGVSAGALGEEGCGLIRDLVVSGGAGLVVLGGEEAFAAGGYQQSALEPLLPLHSDPDEGERLHTIICLDVSGSMNDAMPGGAATKLDRARAALQPPPALAERESLSVLPFDVAPRAPIEVGRGPDAASALGRALGGLGAGGGTDLFAAVTRAYERLAETGAEKRRVIVLSDGETRVDDAAVSALERARAAPGNEDAKVTIVLVGEQADVPPGVARLRELTDAALRTVGDWDELAATLREELPEMRDLVVRGPFDVSARDPGPIGPLPATLPSIERMNRTRPRDDVAPALVAGEDEMPLLALAPAGNGRVVAFTSRVAKGWAPAWSEASGTALLGRAFAWARRREPPGAIRARARRAGDRVLIEATIVDGRVGAVLQARAGDVTATLAEVEPGVHRGALHLDGGEAPALIALSALEGGPLTAMVAVEPAAVAEWERLEPDRALLAALAAEGGGELLAAAGPVPLVAASAPAAPVRVSLRLPLAALAVLLLLAEGALRAGVWLTARGR